MEHLRCLEIGPGLLTKDNGLGTHSPKIQDTPTAGLQERWRLWERSSDVGGWRDPRQWVDRPRCCLVHSQVGGLETKTKAKMTVPLFQRSLQCDILFYSLVLSFQLQWASWEWRSTPWPDWRTWLVCTYCKWLSKKVQYYHSKRVIGSYTRYILPVMNPDGYLYSWVKMDNK